VPASKEEVNRRGSEDYRESEISFMLQGEKEKRLFSLEYIYKIQIGIFSVTRALQI
jgi:hypothetical protein